MIRVVLFDWGDTVMRVFPEYEGPMAHWPRVEAVLGIEEALRALHPHYRLILATNAAASGEALVRKALERVGLEEYFDAVFTARELGMRKPDPAFFQVMLRTLDCAPHEAAMVGDDYQADVAGAKRAGLWTVWFNPAGTSPPVGSPIATDVEIQDLLELDKALRLLNSQVETPQRI